MANAILKHFESARLPDHLQAISAPMADLTEHLNEILPDGPEKSVGLRKLLEAKDFMVRAVLS